MTGLPKKGTFDNFILTYQKGEGVERKIYLKNTNAIKPRFKMLFNGIASYVIVFLMQIFQFEIYILQHVL